MRILGADMKDELFDSLLKSVHQGDYILKDKQKAVHMTEVKLPEGASLVRPTDRKKS